MSLPPTSPLPPSPPISIPPSGARPRALGAGVAAGLVLVLAIVLRVVWFPVVDRSPDEKLWTQFGSSVAREGPAWLTRLARDFAAEKDVEFPWPHRSAYVGLVALAMRVSGRPVVQTTEAVSTVASVLMIALAGLLAAHAFGPWAAPLAMLFLAVSPLDLALA